MAHDNINMETMISRYKIEEQGKEQLRLIGEINLRHWIPKYKTEKKQYKLR